MSAAVTSYKNRAYKNSIKSAAKSELLHFCKAWQVCMQKKSQGETHAATIQSA